jgi:hypothetical protein
VDWIAEAVASLIGPRGAFTWGQLRSGRAARIAVSRGEGYSAVWLAVRTPPGYESAAVLLLPVDGDGWSSSGGVLFIDDWEALPVPRPDTEWEDWGPVCWETQVWWESHDAHVEHHAGHEHQIGELPVSVLAYGGVAAQNVESILVRLENRDETLLVDPRTGVFFGTFETETNSCETWARTRDGECLGL